MTPLINTYHITVIRESGENPITGQFVERAEEDLIIDATTSQAAHKLAQIMTSIQFRGQLMRIIIDGQEHFDDTL